MEIPKIVQDLLDKKAEMSNTIDLDAYANGLLDMYNALQNNDKKRSVAVISLDIIDFKHWKVENDFKEDGVSTVRKFISGNTTYHCICEPCDLCSLVLDEIIETNRAKDNKDYDKIILSAEAALNIY